MQCPSDCEHQVCRWGDWVAKSWRWDWFFTGTFTDPDEPSRLRGHTSVGWSLSDRRYREWVRDSLESRADIGSVYWFRGREPHKHRNTTHFHALIGGVGNLSRRDAWRGWFERNGRARIEPVRSVGDVALYVAKYVVKDQGELTFSANAGLHKVGGLASEHFDFGRPPEWGLPSRGVRGDDAL